jgi:hypothetical protein
VDPIDLGALSSPDAGHSRGPPYVGLLGGVEIQGLGDYVASLIGVVPAREGG